MTKVRVSQLAQSGATPLQVATWNGAEWAPTTPANSVAFYDDVLAAGGGETIITLGNAPLSRSERISKNQTLLDRGTDYTISGQVVTLTVAAVSGDKIRDYYAYPATATGAGAVLTGPGSSSGSLAPYDLAAYSPAFYL